MYSFIEILVILFTLFAVPFLLLVLWEVEKWVKK